MAIAHDADTKEEQQEDTKMNEAHNMQIVVGLPSFSSNHAVCDDLVNPKPKREKRKRSDDKASLSSSTDATERANAVALLLPPEFPNFVKSMLRSHVTNGFWLGLPKRFCVRHLPKEDTAVTLEDESGECYETKYLSLKTGLSGGWRGFSIAHDLVEGDAVVFQLVSPTKFKVYIVRSSFDAVDSNSNTTPTLIEDDHYWEPLASDTHPPIAPEPEQCSDELICEILDGIRFSQSAIAFKDIKSIEDFTVIVDGLVIDSEISKHIMVKYYGLCCSQNRFLHDGIVNGINCKLAAGIISETVNIADAIRASKITTSADNFSTWGRTLRAFGDLGMEVGFLLDRLDKLVKLDGEPRRVKDAKRERVDAEKEIGVMEGKVVEMKERVKRLDAEIALLEKNENVVEFMFREIAKAPW